MRISPLRLWPHGGLCPSSAADTQTAPSGAVLLDALHQLPSGFAPSQAKRCERAFRQAVAQDPTDGLAQAGLLQILRERAVRHGHFWPHQMRHKQALGHKALVQLGVLLQRPAAAGLADVLQHADDLWTLCTTPASEATLREVILVGLGAVLSGPDSSHTDISAALKALDRLSVLQPWTLPVVVEQLGSYAQRTQLTPGHITLVPPILQRALALPLGLGPNIVLIAEQLCRAYPTDLSVLLAGCQMLKGVVLMGTPPLALAQRAIAQMLVLGTAVPGEQVSYEAARLLLQAAQHYDSERSADSTTLAVMALNAVQGILDAGQGRAGDVMVRSMSERTLLQLEQTGQTPVAQVATAHLAARGETRRRVNAPRVS